MSELANIKTELASLLRIGEEEVDRLLVLLHLAKAEPQVNKIVGGLQKDLAAAPVISTPSIAATASVDVTTKS